MINRLAEAGMEFFTSREILDEFHTVLEREFPLYSQERLDAIIDLCTIVELHDIERVVPDDPDDDKVIATALAAGADLILTYDRHLLTLRECRGVRIRRPDTALK